MSNPRQRRRPTARPAAPKPRPGLMHRWRRRWRGLFRTDFAVEHTTASAMLVAVIAIMTVLAALALATERSLTLVTAQWTNDLAGVLTIELPPAASPAAAQARMQAILVLLAGEAPVAAARPVERERVVALLEPWIGAAARTPDLPVPELIEVIVRPGERLDARALQSRLLATEPALRVDDHSQLRDGATRLGGIASIAAAAVLALIGAAAAGAVVFATSAGVAAHRDAIEVLHQMGASDAYVARQFAVHAGSVGVLGGLLGLLIAMLALLVLDQSLPRFTGLASLPPNGTVATLSRIAALPPLAGLMTLVTAWRTVMRALRHLM
jgi:cell division transport system permease protein